MLNKCSMVTEDLWEGKKVQNKSHILSHHDVRGTEFRHENDIMEGKQKTSPDGACLGWQHWTYSSRESAPPDSPRFVI
jgi:hypothetical protein